MGNKLWMNLQHFADLPHVGDGEIRDDGFDDLEDVDGQDVDEGQDDTPDVGEDDELDEDLDLEEDEEEVEDDEKDEKDDQAADKDGTKGRDEGTFSPKQQEKVDAIVRSRLERAEVTRLRELSKYAGDSLTNEDIKGAARLWGLLRRNPGLSRSIDQLIEQETRAGRVTHHVVDTTSEKERELAVREALIDLKASDKVFNRHSEAILTWAEDQGFNIDDKKSLELAYMAWKGANARLLSANKALRDKKKGARSPQKAQTKRRAAVEAGSRGSKRGNLNYQKMSDEDILRSEGLSLFTDDD